MKIVKLPEKLEDQIDAPIKKCIAMLNLLGLKTLWSCCGFDYRGQPKFKDHAYGNAHIFIDFNSGIKNINELLFIRSKSGWSLSVANVSCTEAWLLEAPSVFGSEMWNNKDSIHYHESSNISIKNLETFLVGMEELMLEKVVLADENTVMKELFEYWQHEPAEDWVIKKEEII